MTERQLIKKLGETKLKQPKGLRNFIYKETSYTSTCDCRIYYVNTLEMWRGRLLMRTFAYKPSKTVRPKFMGIQEVCRRLEGSKQVILSQIENTCLAGRRVYFTETGNWVTKQHNDGFYAWYAADKRNWWFYDYNMFDTNEWIQKLDIKYCGYDSENYRYKLPFLEYVELYRKYPKIEILAKAGLCGLISGARYFNFKGKSFEQIFKIPKIWKSELYGLTASDILVIRKSKAKNKGELEAYKNLKHYKNIKKYYSSRTLEYIGKLGYNLSTYNDYLGFAEKLGYPMNHNKVLYPEDIKTSHDELLNKIEINNSKELDAGIKKTAKKLMKYQFASNGLVIIPVKSNMELIEESKALNHCVREYGKSISNGETGVLFIRSESQIDLPYVTLELKGKNIIQVRAHNNDEPPEQVQQFVRQWEKQFRLQGY